MVKMHSRSDALFSPLTTTDRYQVAQDQPSSITYTSGLDNKGTGTEEVNLNAYMLANTVVYGGWSMIPNGETTNYGQAALLAPWVNYTVYAVRYRVTIYPTSGPAETSASNIRLTFFASADASFTANTFTQAYDGRYFTPSSIRGLQQTAIVSSPRPGSNSPMVLTLYVNIAKHLNISKEEFRTAPEFKGTISTFTSGSNLQSNNYLAGLTNPPNNAARVNFGLIAQGNYVTGAYETLPAHTLTIEKTAYVKLSYPRTAGNTFADNNNAQA